MTRTPTRTCGRPPTSHATTSSGFTAGRGAHSDTTINTLTLDAIGHVPHWPDDRSEVTLHHILVHMIAETHRHAGHADIVRASIDGATGMRQNDSMAPGDQAWWENYRNRLERVAQEASRI